MVKFLVVVGASAGGLEPLQKLVKGLPEQMPDTAIIIAQHTSPRFESLLASLLGKNTILPVKEITEGEKLQSNYIYTCPPNANVEIQEDRFLFVKNKEISPSPSADILFGSAARALKERVTAVVLSGTGRDGTKGIMEVKKHGGITLAQDPTTASYPGMPDSSILTEHIDIVMPAEEIGMELFRLLDDDYRSQIAKQAKAPGTDLPEEDVNTVKEILNLLHKKTGTDFSGYKTSTIYRRLEKRIHDKNYKNIENYIQFVKDDPEELDRLFLYLLIGVTHFFRDPEAMRALKENLKQSLKDHPVGKDFRVWIPGCASGEEAYTISMILHELVDNGSPEPEKIQIFATDIDQLPLTKARTGIYSAESMIHLPEEYKTKYFTRVGDRFQVNKNVKKPILFSKHDLTSNPPFLRINMVSCRNLLIYFNSALQSQVLPLFHYTLDNNGILFLGKSENVSKHKNLFETLDSKNKIFRKRPVDTKIARVSALHAFARKNVAEEVELQTVQDLSIPDIVKETFYNAYEYPYIVVDNGLNIVELNKDLSMYLELPSGAPHYLATKMVHKNLRLDLRSLVSKAHDIQGPVTGDYKRVEKDGKTEHVRLKVQPAVYARPSSPYYIVTFQHREPEENSVITITDDQADQTPLIAELEHELAATREHLNTIVEELETSNEELQSLNEEMQSSNEELQASNEELETSNEELQATNEELNVAYQELTTTSQKLEVQGAELEMSESKTRSLLDNSQQAFVLVDEDMRVDLFNNYAYNVFKEVFNVRISKNALFSKLLPSEYLKNFRKYLKEAMDGEQLEIEQQVADNEGRERFFSFNFTPVINKAGKVDKVSVSFIDTTDKVKFQKELERERRYWQGIFDNSPILNAVFNAKDLKIVYANKTLNNFFPDKTITGKKLTDVFPELNMVEIMELVERIKISTNSETIADVPVETGKTGEQESGIKYFDFIMAVSEDIDQKKTNVVLHALDVTREVLEKQKANEEKVFMDLIAGALPQQVWVALPDGSLEFTNKSAKRFFGQYLPKSLGEILDCVDEDSRKPLEEVLDKVRNNGGAQSIDCLLSNGKNKKRWHNLQINPIREKGKKVSKLIVSATDIHEQWKIQQKKDEFIGVASHELKTPLTSVKAYTELLKEHLKESNDETTNEFLDRTGKGVSKLEKFVSDILDISRIQQGKLTLTKKAGSLAERVIQVVDNFNTLSNTHKVVLKMPDDKLPLEADFDRLEQVMINLINNAVKYSPDASKIFITIFKNLDNMQISVRDEGIGIEESDYQRIFDRFYRNTEINNNISGMGIGLNISREIILLHGGQIWVESEPGKGSVFHFTLPLATA